MKAITCLGVIAFLCSLTARALAQEPLAQVKELYNSASYSEALAALTDVPSTADMVDVEKYRALCLLALGRSSEAERSLQTLAMNRPLYSFDENDASPRLVNLYQDVRRRTLPEASKLMYQRARMSFDNGNMEDAVRQFKDVLLLADSAPQEHQAFMTELRMLASGFVRLAETPAPAARPAPAAVVSSSAVTTHPAAAPTTVPASSAPAPVSASNGAATPVSAPPVAAPPPARAAAAPAPAAVSPSVVQRPVVETIYDLSDATVKPPVVRLRTLPPWSRPGALRNLAFKGTLEVIVGEDGRVASARMISGTHNMYDTILLSAARRWRYDAAMLDGKPVKYRLAYPIVIAPASAQPQ